MDVFPSPTNLTLFLTASLALLLTPGPAVLYVVARSMDQGRRAGLISVLSIQTGTSVHVIAAALGLSAILMSSALAFDIVKYLGAAYLIYLGLRKIFGKEAVVTDEVAEPASLRTIFRQGVLVGLLNPKTALFFFAFLPQFADPSRGAVSTQMLVLGLMFTTMALVTDSCYALLAGTAGRWLKNSTAYLRFQRYFAGTVYIGLGLTAALASSGRK